MHLAAGSEHNPAGVITENAKNRARMMEKRMGKLDSMREDLPKPAVHGDPAAEIAISGTVPIAGRSLEAQHRLREEGVATRFFEFRTLWPFPEDEVREFIADARHVFVVENNFTGQLERLVRYVVGPLERMHGVLKYNGRPFRPIEIVEPVLKVAAPRALAEVKR